MIVFDSHFLQSSCLFSLQLINIFIFLCLIVCTHLYFQGWKCAQHLRVWFQESLDIWTEGNLALGARPADLQGGRVVFHGFRGFLHGLLHRSSHPGHPQATEGLGWGVQGLVMTCIWPFGIYVKENGDLGLRLISKDQIFGRLLKFQFKPDQSHQLTIGRTSCPCPQVHRPFS